MTSQPAPATITAGEDFAERWRPDPAAVTAAAAALNLEPAAVDLAAIPLYMPGKRQGFWTTGQEIRTVPGVVFCGVNSCDVPAGLRGYDEARNAAARAAWDAMGDQPGTVGWATVSRDGSACVIEDPLTRADGSDHPLNIVTPWDEARALTGEQLGEEIGEMAIRRALGKRTGRELAFLDVLHQQQPGICRCPARYTPHWLHERVNDPLGTPGRHSFWGTQAAERIGPWKLFERDGTWYAYETRQNAWAHFPDRDAAAEHAAGPTADIWA